MLLESLNTSLKSNALNGTSHSYITKELPCMNPIVKTNPKRKLEVIK